MALTGSGSSRVGARVSSGVDKSGFFSLAYSCVLCSLCSERIFAPLPALPALRAISRFPVLFFGSFGSFGKRLVTADVMDPEQIRVKKDKAFDLSGGSIEILVGPKQARFSAHETLLTSSSAFFAKALSPPWNEASTRSISLPDVDPPTFETYLHYLYRRTLPVRIDSPGHEGNAEYLLLAKAYVLGDMLQAPSFRDAAIDAIIKKATTKASDGATWFPVGGVIRYVYENTVEGAPVRRLLVDLYTHHGHGNWLEEWAEWEDLPKEFLWGLAVALLEGRASKNRGFVSGLGGCEYHEHEGILNCRK